MISIVWENQLVKPLYTEISLKTIIVFILFFLMLFIFFFILDEERKTC